MCCCKYLANQTSGPSRQAPSHVERARLMQGFVGEGRASIPIQMLPTCGFRSEELTACAHDRANGSFSCSICHYIYKYVCSAVFWSCSIVETSEIIKFVRFLCIVVEKIIGHIFAVQSHNQSDFMTNLPVSISRFKDEIKINTITSQTLSHRFWEWCKSLGIKSLWRGDVAIQDCVDSLQVESAPCMLKSGCVCVYEFPATFRLCFKIKPFL